MVRGADDAFLLHLLDQLGRLVVADVQVPLNERGGGFALPRNDRYRLIEEAFVAVGSARDAGQQWIRLGAAAWAVHRICHVVDIGWLALFAQERHDLFYFFVRNERAVHAGNPPAALLEQ